MSARVKAFFGVAAVDIVPSALRGVESSRGQVKVAFVRMMSPSPLYGSIRETSFNVIYFSMRRHETNPDDQ